MKKDRSDGASCGARLEYFAERLNLVFAYFLCTLEFEGDEDFTADSATSDRAWALHTIQNACLHTTLIALRDLDDFFTLRNRRSRPDDLRAADFGYKKSLNFLSRSERRAIDKNIVHSTLVGADTRDFRWDVLELVAKAVSQAAEFLRWAEAEFGEDFIAFSSALVCRHKTQAICDYIAKKRNR